MYGLALHKINFRTLINILYFLELTSEHLLKSVGKRKGTCLLISCLVTLQLLVKRVKPSQKYLPGGKERLARKADNLTAVCESIV
jgi:hypothetical protein